MSEFIPQHSPESPLDNPETVSHPPHSHESNPAELAGEHAHKDSLETIRQSIEEHALKAEQTTSRMQGEKPAAKAASSGLNIDRELRAHTTRRSLQHIRHQLSPSQRLLSGVVHQPIIRALSTISAPTIGRPSGLLGGGITAFVGSALYFYLTHHIGLTYNYLIFCGFFVVGFALGVAIEWIVYFSRHR